MIKGAASRCKAALALNFGNVSARNLYADFLIRQDRYDDAICLLRDGMEFDTDDGRLKHKLALAYAGSGAKQEDVLVSFSRAAQTLPAQWPAYLDMAIYLYLSGRERDAMEIFERLREVQIDRAEMRRFRNIRALSRGVSMERTGVLVFLRQESGYIRSENSSTDVYLDRYHVRPEIDTSLEVGARVEYELGFNMFGPTARHVRRISGW